MLLEEVSSIRVSYEDTGKNRDTHSELIILNRQGKDGRE